MLLLTLVVMGATCDVKGTKVSMRAIDVAVAGRKPTRVGVTEIELIAHIDGKGVSLEATSPVAFTGKAPRVWLQVNRAFTSEDGLVKLNPGAQVIPRRVVNDKVEVDVVLWSDDVLPNENDKSPQEVLSTVLMPCDALTFEAGDEPAPELEAGDLDELRSAKPRSGSSVSFRAAPNANAAKRTLRAIDCSNCLAVTVLSTRKGWHEVSTVWTGEVSARGFVPVGELKLLPEDELVGRSAMCSGDHHDNELNGFGLSGDGFIDGRAQVKAGAAVFIDGKPSAILFRTTAPLGAWVVGRPLELTLSVMSSEAVTIDPTRGATVAASDLVEIPPVKNGKK